MRKSTEQEQALAQLRNRGFVNTFALIKLHPAFLRESIRNRHFITHCERAEGFQNAWVERATAESTIKANALLKKASERAKATTAEWYKRNRTAWNNSTKDEKDIIAQLIRTLHNANWATYQESLDCFLGMHLR